MFVHIKIVRGLDFSTLEITIACSDGSLIASFARAAASLTLRGPYLVRTDSARSNESSDSPAALK